MNTPRPGVFAAHSNAFAPNLRIGIDIARIGPIEASLAEFGPHFLRRIFSEEEAAYALQVPAQTGQRLAARFAAKEAAMKAFNLSEAGVGWRDIEVRRDAEGACTLALHGRAAAVAEQTGCTEMAVSLSHDGDYATAMVAAVRPQGQGATAGPSLPPISTPEPPARPSFQPEIFRD